MMPEDMSVFFDDGDFAVPVTRQRTAVADLALSGIPGVVDQEAMQGRVMTAQYELRFARADVAEGDTLVFAEDVMAGAAVVIRAGNYFVLRLDIDNDGSEMCAYLSDTA